jgi:hypothetical protein
MHKPLAFAVRRAAIESINCVILEAIIKLDSNERRDMSNTTTEATPLTSPRYREFPPPPSLSDHLVCTWTQSIDGIDGKYPPPCAAGRLCGYRLDRESRARGCGAGDLPHRCQIASGNKTHRRPVSAQLCSELARSADTTIVVDACWQHAFDVRFVQYEKLRRRLG